MLGPNGFETGVHKLVLAALQRKARASAISLESLEMTNMFWVKENRNEMAENEWDAKLTLRPLYKDFGKGHILGPNGIETGVQKFVLSALQRKARASAVSLGSLAMRNMLWLVENGTEMAANEWDAKPSLRPLYKDFGRFRVSGQMALKQACTNLFWQHCSGKQGLLQLV